MSYITDGLWSFLCENSWWGEQWSPGTWRREKICWQDWLTLDQTFLIMNKSLPYNEFLELWTRTFKKTPPHGCGGGVGGFWRWLGPVKYPKIYISMQMTSSTCTRTSTSSWSLFCLTESTQCLIRQLECVWVRDSGLEGHRDLNL